MSRFTFIIGTLRTVNDRTLSVFGRDKNAADERGDFGLISVESVYVDPLDNSLVTLYKDLKKYQRMEAITVAQATKASVADDDYVALRQISAACGFMYEVELSFKNAKVEYISKEEYGICCYKGIERTLNNK